MTELADALARKRALNPHASFIVQAPAGSGKTELLIQRYLTLLKQVDVPEAVLALTFTRKAALEMRTRIIAALEKAQYPLPNEASPQEIARYQLANAVLQQNQKKNWQLLTNLNRFRIQTLDSFCQSLIRQMPLLSTLTDTLSPTDQPTFLYRLAAQELLTALESSAPWQKSLAYLLGHLDNRLDYLEDLLTEVLATREQWLPYLTTNPTILRTQLESSLQTVRDEQVNNLNNHFPKAYFSELADLLIFSLNHRPQSKSSFSIESTELNTQHPDFIFWQAASHLLLKETNQWRQQVSLRDGFPPPSTEKDPIQKAYYGEMKRRATDLLATLQPQHELLVDLIHLKNAPPSSYTEQQWIILEALCELLPVLVAHLKVIFQTYRKVDYTEILLGALKALGEEEHPTDLALHLDYQIQHILIDEFQDTSITQFALIKQLIAAWQPEEGKTFFLVGDPMQSIYRFRKAEVGLFLQVQKTGIGALPCETLRLSVNFRANAKLVTWINHCFAQLLPKKENPHHGAIAFSPSEAFDTAPSTQPAVQIVCFAKSNAQIEADKMVTLIQNIRMQTPNDSIAILVRARTHLLTLLPTLKKAGIAYQAIEIESLADKGVIQDLICLTRALFHLGDRISWLALLRAPFCGLDLHDLYTITHYQTVRSPAILWEQLLAFETIPLRQATQQRLRRIIPLLKQAFIQKKYALSLAGWVKQTWLALGGPLTLDTKEGLIAVQTYFQHLENRSGNHRDASDFSELETELAKLNLPSLPPQPGCIDIMTIHKAKGLEYDHIFLPSLHRSGMQDREKIWRYEERLTTTHPHLIIAPIKASDQKADPIYNYLLYEDKQKAEYELTRLLYVASTRARKSLTLLTYRDITKPTAPKHSLLAQLLPVLNTTQSDPLPIITENNDDATPPIQSSVQRLKRCPSFWVNPYPVWSSHLPEHSLLPSSQANEDSESALLGTLVHRFLYHLSQEALSHWEQHTYTTAKLRQWLKQLNISDQKRDHIIAFLSKTIANVLDDPRGRWLFDPTHQFAKAEFSVTVAEFGRLKQWIIDRYLIDQHGTHWIIDYKVTTQVITEPECFLKEAVKQHQPQLETYANALTLDAEFPKHAKLYLGLYFPYQSLWYAWPYRIRKTPYCTKNEV